MKTVGLDIFGDDTPSLPKLDVLPTAEQSHRWRGTFLGVAGAIVGSLLWPQHRYLGAFGGYILGHDGYRLIAREGSRNSSITRIGSAGAAIAGATLLPISPALGFTVGAVGGNVIASFLGDD